jgi:hypothetical protein
MRFAITTIVAVGLVTPPVILATSASTPGYAATKITEFSSEQKKKKKKTEDNVKSAPTAPPSDNNKSSY